MEINTKVPGDDATTLALLQTAKKKKTQNNSADQQAIIKTEKTPFEKT